MGKRDGERVELRDFCLIIITIIMKTNSVKKLFSIIARIFLPARSSVRAADTVVALLFLFVKIKTNASYNED